MLFFTDEELRGSKDKAVSGRSVDVVVSGGISGAISNPFSERADAHAKMFYEEIRHNHSDVERIVRNTGFSIEDVLHVKNFLFIDVHLLEDGEIKRFDESFPIAESWRRLAFEPKLIQKHDITLLHHEIYERKLMAQGLSQKEAHEKHQKSIIILKKLKNSMKNLITKK